MRALFASILGAALAAAADVDTATTTLQDTLAFPFALDAGDLNGDDVVDVAVAVRDGDSVMWIDGATGDSHTLSTAVPDARGVCVSDLDGDGAPDVAATARGSDEIHVFMNPFDAPAAVFATAGAPWGLKAGDVTGDGVTDVVYAAAGVGVVVLVGPDFTSELATPATLRDARDPELVDLDADGVLDVVATDNLAHYLLVFEGGSLALRQNVSAADLNHRLARAADADGDGDQDVFVSTSTKIKWLENTGDGTLVAAGTVASTAVGGVRLMALADLDMDGALDVAYASNTENHVSWLPGGVYGGGESRVLAANATGANGLALADFDADGDLDVFATTSTAVLGIEVQTVPFAPANLTATAELTGAATVGATPVSVTLSWAAADDNGSPVTLYTVNPGNVTTADTSVTLANAQALYESASFTVSAANARGSGSSAAAQAPAVSAAVEVTDPARYPGAAYGNTMAASGDLNGDGVPDLVVSAQDSGSVAWYDIAAGGEEHVLITSYYNAFAVCVADVDADGLLDVVATSRSNDDFHVFYNNGSELVVSAHATRTVQAADATDDGVVDLIYAADDSGDVVVRPGPDFAAEIVLDTLGSVSFAQIGVGDVTGDGKPDVVVPTRDDGLHVYSELTQVQYIEGPAEAWQSKLVDVDDDGDLDLLLTSNTDGVCLFENDGEGQFAAHKSILPITVSALISDELRSLDVGDVDLDGMLDVVYGRYRSAEVWLGRRDSSSGNWTSQLLSTDTVSTYFSHVLADFDADGDLDLAATSILESDLAVFEVQTVPFAAAVNATAELTGAVTVGATPVSVTLSWAAADDNGSPVTLYTVNPGNVTTADTSITLANVAPLGDTSTFTVSATSARGAGLTSSASVLPTASLEVAPAALGSLSDPKLVASGDFDGDGTSDVTVATYDGRVAWFNASGAAHVLSSAIDDARDLTVGDVNADGLVDVVAVSDATVHIFFSPFDASPTVLSTGDQPYAAGVCDANGDGAPDVIVGTGDLFYFAGPGFNTTTLIATDVVVNAVAVSDTDMFVAGDVQFMWLARQNSSSWEVAGTWPASAARDVQFASSLNVALAIDSDAILRFDREADGGFGDPVVVQVGGDLVAGGDLDLDGELEVVVAATAANELRVLWADGESTLLQSLDAPSSVALGDFDADGDLDIFVAAALEVQVLDVQTVPFAPTDVVLTPLEDSSQLLVTWTAPADNGAAIEGYQINGGYSSVLDVRDATNVWVAAINWRGVGPASASVEYAGQCADGVRNANETDVDCGGSVCGACHQGQLCLVDGDCVNGECAEWGRCASCSDGVLNQGETSVDCGGQWCGPCLTACVGVDYGVFVAWEPDPSLGDEFVVEGVGTVAALNVTVTGLDNYVAVDVVVRGAGPNATCTATPTPPTTLVEAAVPAWQSEGRVALGDVDGDGFVDAFVGTQFYAGNGTAFVLSSALGPFASGDSPALGDFDGDGDVDLVLGAADGSLQYFTNPDFSTDIGGPQLPAGATDAVPSIASSSAVIVATASGDVYVCEVDANCTLSVEWTGTSVSLCDVDGDGVDEALVVDAAGDVTVDGEVVATTAADSAACVAGFGVALGTVDFLALVSHPEPPTDLSWTLTSLTSADLDWTPPSVDGGDPVTQYIVRGAPEGLTGLAVGEVYEVTVSSVNAYGESAESDPLSLVMPDVVVTATATQERGEANVSWAINDAAALAFVTDAVVSPGNVSVAASPALVPELTACEPYEFNVSFLPDFVLWGSAMMATPPVGVCPGVCSASPTTAWIDPTLASPFQVECDGNWTLLDSGISLLDLSTHLRVGRDDGASLLVELATGTVVSGDGATAVVSVNESAVGSLVVSSGGQWAAVAELGEWTAQDPVEGATFAVATVLETTVVRQPAAVLSTVVNVSTDVELSTNAEAAGIEARFGESEWAAWGSVAYDASAEGEHMLEVRSVLDPWMASPITRVVWESDFTAPVTGFSPQPADFEAQTSAEFGLAASEAGVVFQYCLDGTVCASVASDDGDDVDDAPETELVSAPANPVMTPTDDVVVSSPTGSSFAASTDSGAWAAATDTVSHSGLDDGWHALQVRAVDSAGSVDPSPLALGFSLGVDPVLPDTALVAGPADVVYVGEPVAFVVEASEAGCAFEYSLDLGASWTPMASDNVTLTDAADEEGLFHALLRAVDAAGNADPAPLAVSWQVSLPLAPETWFEDGIVANGTGVAVEYSWDLGASWLSSSHVEMPAEDGFYVLAARAVNAAGVEDPTPAMTSVYVGAAPEQRFALTPLADSPFSMSVFAVELLGASGCALTWSVNGDSGDVGEDGVFVVGPLLLGTYTVTVSGPDCGLDDISYTWTVAAEDSSLSASFDALSEGEHSMEAYATDEAGNVGLPTTFNWTVDVTPPVTLLDAPALIVTTEADLALNASCDDALECVFEVVVDSAAAELLESPLIVPDLVEGSHEIVVTAVDLAGNVAANNETVSVYVDTTPPAIVVTEGHNVTNAPRFVVECVDLSGCASFEVDSSPVPSDGVVEPTGLDDGAFVLHFAAVDLTANEAELAFPFAVDTTAPTTVYSGPAALVTNDSVVLPQLSVDCVDLHGCRVNASISDAALADGDYVVLLQAVDEAGNADPSPVSVPVAVDTTPPVVSLAGVSQEGTTLTLDLECADATACSFQLSSPTAVVDGTEATATDGLHDLRVDVVDEAGNMGAPLLLTDVVFDSVAPVVTVTSAPSAYTPSASNEVEWLVVDENLVECLCDGAVCGNPATVDTADEGVVSLAIECVDLRGHVGAVNVTWTVDRTAPVTNLTTAVPAATNEATWAFEFAVDDLTPVTTSCALQGPASVLDNDCKSPFEVDLGSDGVYTFNVSATDAAGNVGASAGLSFTLDTVAPELTVFEAPPDTVTSQPVPIVFGCTRTDATDVCGDPVTDDDCSLSFTINGDGPNSTDDGVLSLTTATLDAPTTVVLYGEDAAGNVGSQTVQWTVLSEVVVPVITSAPAESTPLTTAFFKWNATVRDVAFVFRVDDDDWSAPQLACNVTLPAVADNAVHTFNVAIEGSEDSPATHVWTVEHCAPGELEFAADDAGGALVCEPCPEQGVRCTDDGLGELLPGYWRSSTSTEVRGDDVFYECPEPDTCLGGAACAEGHTGVLCALCADGYADTVGGCQPCPDSAGGSVVLLLVVAMAMVGLLVAVLKKSKQIVKGSAFKVVLNFVHMVSAIIAFDVPWPDLVVWLVESLGVVNVDVTELTAAGCAGLPVTFYVKWLLVILVPACIVAGVWVRYKLLEGAQRSAALRNSLLVLLFLYPGVSGQLIQFFNCQHIEGRWYLRADYSQHCLEGAWYGWLSVAVVLTPAFVLGVPGVMLYWLTGHRDSLGDEETVRSIGLLYRSYRLEQYHHEVWVLLYKLFLWSAAVLLADGVVTQTMTALFLSLGMLVFHTLTWPYKDREKNMLQLLNYVTACTLCIGGLALKLSDSAAVRGETQSVLRVLDVVVVAQVVALLVGTLAAKVTIRRRRQRAKSEELELSSVIATPPVTTPLPVAADAPKFSSVVNPMMSGTPGVGGAGRGPGRL